MSKQFQEYRKGIKKFQCESTTTPEIITLDCTIDENVDPMILMNMRESD